MRPPVKNARVDDAQTVCLHIEAPSLRDVYTSAFHHYIIATSPSVVD